MQVSTKVILTGNGEASGLLGRAEANVKLNMYRLTLTSHIDEGLALRAGSVVAYLASGVSVSHADVHSRTTGQYCQCGSGPFSVVGYRPAECTHYSYNLGNPSMPEECNRNCPIQTHYGNGGMRMMYAIGPGGDYNHSTININYRSKLTQNTIFGIFHSSYHYFEEVEMTGSFSVDTAERVYGASFIALASQHTAFVSCKTSISYWNDR